MASVISEGSRAACAVEALDVGEELTTCHHCGGRTIVDDEVCINEGASRREVCFHCEQRYDVEDDIEDIFDDEDGVDDDAPLPSAGEEALKELLSRSPYPEFGTF